MASLIPNSGVWANEVPDRTLQKMNVINVKRYIH
jgi:hypothetical protein